MTNAATPTPALTAPVYQSTRLSEATNGTAARLPTPAAAIPPPHPNVHRRAFSSERERCAAIQARRPIGSDLPSAGLAASGIGQRSCALAREPKIAPLAASSTIARVTTRDEATSPGDRQSAPREQRSPLPDRVSNLGGNL